MHACTLQHRPPVFLPQDAVFQLFKPRRKLSAQSLEGKAGRIPAITVWLVDWLQLARLSLEDLHIKRPRQARCGYDEDPDVCCSGPFQRLANKGGCWETRIRQNYINDSDLQHQDGSSSVHSIQLVLYIIIAAANKIKELSSIYMVWRNLLSPFTVSVCFLPSSAKEGLSSGPPLS